MDAQHPLPFPYEDTLESSIQSLIAHNNRFDPTGKSNDLRVPPHRIQQSLRHPKWYSTSLHASTPYLSASIAQTSSKTLTPSIPFPLIITLHHHPSPTGSPSSQPITFHLQDTHLPTIDPVEFYPWLLLLHQHEPNSLSKNLDSKKPKAIGVMRVTVLLSRWRVSTIIATTLGQSHHQRNDNDQNRRCCPGTTAS